MFIVTVDNASCNDVVAYLKRKLVNWGNNILNCKYLPMRCICHIIKLIAVDGLKDNINPITKVKETVRYVRQSLVRS